MANLIKIHPVVLSGGAGSRLWPISRTAYPKQFLALNGTGSLLQQTLRRVADPGLFQRPLIIANNEHRFLAAEQAQTIGVEPRAIVLEPVGRNTAPAAAVAALMVGQEDPNALVLLLPSDHVIRDLEAFHEACRLAAEVARRGHLVTFGMKAERPDTGYGYIRRGAPLAGLKGAYSVATFVEKPDLETATRYVAEGGYDWNSGMFLFPAGLLLSEMGRLSPAVYQAAERAHAAARSDLDFLRLDENAFATAPALSIDVAVMEGTDKAAVLPCELGWNDVGAWHALWELAEKDRAGNAIQGDVVALESKGCYLHSEDGPMIAVTGLEDCVVVATADAVLVAPRARAGDAKQLVELLKDQGRSEGEQHRRVYRPWGDYTDTDQGPRFRVKRIIVKPGGCLSLQRHQHRSEHWVIVEGEAQVALGGDKVTLKANQSTYIPKGVVHRLENTGTEPLHLIEVQVGDYVGEDDIERLEDTYGRS